MKRAEWQGVVIAESCDIVVVDGYAYFPPDAVVEGVLRASATRTVCGWKGTASYYDVVVGGEVDRDAAWSYTTPKEAAKKIAGRIAFWRGVTVRDV